MGKKQPVVAIAYDFDGTLAPGNMQEHSFLPSVGVDKDTFWKEVQEISKKEQADMILVYMKHMIDKAREAKIKFTKEAIQEHGKQITLFEGVEKWFNFINTYGKSQNVKVEHYLISSGNEEIFNGTSIKKYFKSVYASKFMYDPNGAAAWPALAIDYTTKTQFLFRINKGITDITDAQGVNNYVPKNKRDIPFENMIFIGDGATDIPCFRMVKEMGGMSVAVYKPYTNSDLSKTLLDQGRIHCRFPANYEKDKDLYKAICRRIDYISAKDAYEKVL